MGRCYRKVHLVGGASRCADNPVAFGIHDYEATEQSTDSVESVGELYRVYSMG
jgi:hypothetical protein